MRRLLSAFALAVLLLPGAASETRAASPEGNTTEGGDTPVHISGIIGSVTGKGSRERGKGGGSGSNGG